KGPISIAVVATKDARVVEGQKKISSKARIVVVGDSDFASNMYFGNQGNGDFFMNIVSWLVEDEDLISIRPKSPEDRRVTMTVKQSRLVLYLSSVFLPLSIISIGIIIWVKRRR
ncbi:MAG: hypothetical protein ACE5QV_06375, partial [Fidelibacterota bacterium]